MVNVCSKYYNMKQYDNKSIITSTSIYIGLFLIALETTWMSSHNRLVRYDDTRRLHWVILATGRLTRFPWNGPFWAFYRNKYIITYSNMILIAIHLNITSIKSKFCIISVPWQFHDLLFVNLSRENQSFSIASVSQR